MIYGCLQPRELWFIDFNHVHVHVHVHCTKYTWVNGESRLTIKDL